MTALDFAPGNLRVLDTVLGYMPVKPESWHEQLENPLPHGIAGEHPPWTKGEHVLHQARLPVRQAGNHLQEKQDVIAKNRGNERHVENWRGEERVNERGPGDEVADRQGPEDRVEHEG